MIGLRETDAGTILANDKCRTGNDVPRQLETEIRERLRLYTKRFLSKTPCS